MSDSQCFQRLSSSFVDENNVFFLIIDRLPFILWNEYFLFVYCHCNLYDIISFGLLQQQQEMSESKQISCSFYFRSNLTCKIVKFIFFLFVHNWETKIFGCSAYDAPNWGSMWVNVSPNNLFDKGFVFVYWPHISI